MVRSEHYEPDTVKTAYLAFLKQILTHGDSQPRLIKAIARETCRDIVRIFSGIIRLWLFLGTILNDTATEGEIQTPAHQRIFCDSPAKPVPVGFYQIERNTLFREFAGRESPCNNLLEFFIRASHGNSSITRGILDAGGLSLIIMAFTSPEFTAPRLTDEVQGKRLLLNLVDPGYPSTAPIPLQTINYDAATLTVLMHNSQFRSYWSGHTFRHRKALCSLLLRRLTSRPLDTRYAWTRALFLKILS